MADEALRGKTSKIDFRSKARAHLALADRHFNNLIYDAFPAACLELGMAIECLTYQFLQTLEDELDSETVEKR